MRSVMWTGWRRACAGRLRCATRPPGLRRRPALGRAPPHWGYERSSWRGVVLRVRFDILIGANIIWARAFVKSPSSWAHPAQAERSPTLQSKETSPRLLASSFLPLIFIKSKKSSSGLWSAWATRASTWSRKERCLQRGLSKRRWATCAPRRKIFRSRKLSNQRFCALCPSRRFTAETQSTQRRARVT